MSYYIKQMNNGHWYVLRTALSKEPELHCERGGWPSRLLAQRAMDEERSGLGASKAITDARLQGLSSSSPEPHIHVPGTLKECRGAAEEKAWWDAYADARGG